MANIVISGDSSGSVTLSAPAVSGTTVLTLPTTSGTLVVTGGAQTIEFADGSAAAPSITNSGDTNTGIFFPASDTIAFTEGGTEVMRINSSGDVGIGTASPVSKIDLTSLSDAVFSLTASGTRRYQLKTLTSGGAFTIFDDSVSTERLRIDTSGNLGIGTSSPAHKLDVNGGTSRVAQGTTGTAYTLITNTGGDLYMGVDRSTGGGLFTGTLAYSSAIGNGASTALHFATSNTVRTTITSGGKFGIGTTNPSGDFTVSNGGANGFEINPTEGSGASTKINSFNRSSSVYTTLQFDVLDFRVATGSSATERMRIDSSGNLFVGKTSLDTATNGFQVGVNGTELSVSRADDRCALFNRNGSDGTLIFMLRSGGVVGSISVTGSTTAYNTSSDYRLKNTIAPMTGALAKVAQLKPVTYKWNVDGSSGQGFIAHELQAVVPDAVTGEKDAVDKEGKPVYQGVDVSFLVATLTAAIQEQQAIITDLKTRIELLEGTK